MSVFFFQTEYAKYMRILIEEHSLKSLAEYGKHLLFTIMVYVDNWPVSVLSFVTCMEGYTPQISRLAQAIGCFSCPSSCSMCWYVFHFNNQVAIPHTNILVLLFVYTAIMALIHTLRAGEVSLSSSSLSAALRLALLVSFPHRLT